LTVNGQIPGPTIEANWGDTLKITVKNNMKDNGTSIHWHGIRQLNTNNQDGVNGITECPLAPGDTKTYEFQATYYGSSWYHSHFSVQYGDGVTGAIVIHGPASANYDEDLGPLVVQDWFHETTFQKEYGALHAGPPSAENYLLNGINEAVDGKSGSRFKLTFEKGKKYLLRLINTSTDNFFKVHLDGHKFTVISNDFVPIKPYVTDWVPLGVGQRYDVVIEANQAVDNYFLRAVVQFSCANNTNDGLGTSNGIVSYKGAGSGLPTSTAGSFTDDCADPPASSLVPVVSNSVDSSTFSAKESSLPVGGPTPSVQTYGSVFTWSLNGEPIDIDWTNPTLLQVQNGATTFSAPQNVVRLDQANVWTFWVIQNTFPQAHPMHLHGHQFNVLGSGNGTFDGSASSLNFQNPGRRDTVMLPALGWTTIAFQTDNPGSWLLHCHIGWHVGAGLSLQFLERESDIPKAFTLGSDFKTTCDNWDKYYNGLTAYNKTDSGLRRL
jgi:FtsP/CotA-like multicopper oxidase with cupredoxin domain